MFLLILPSFVSEQNGTMFVREALSNPLSFGGTVKRAGRSYQDTTRMGSGVLAPGDHRFDRIARLKAEVDLFVGPMPDRKPILVRAAPLPGAPSGGRPDLDIDWQLGESIRGVFAHAERVIILFFA